MPHELSGRKKTPKSNVYVETLTPSPWCAVITMERGVRAVPYQTQYLICSALISFDLVSSHIRSVVTLSRLMIVRLNQPHYQDLSLAFGRGPWKQAEGGGVGVV